MVRNHFYDVRTGTALMLAFGMIGLLLAAAGLYGVTASVVSRRTREIGVRIALGASPGVIVRHVLAESFAAVGVGLLIGIALAVVIGRVLRSLLFGISAYDPVAFVAAPLVLAAAALVACLGPARRASRVSPMTALRHE
jgi:ABC-type antimicrobial peptide transport system permease subunit